MARLVAYAHAGVDPKYMGIGPIPAVKKALERAGLKVGDMDVIESNEAFAAQACAVAKDLSFDLKKVNPNGGAIALGHPIGATGCILTIKTIYELHRTGGRYGLVTMCIGGGQGIAAMFERCSAVAKGVQLTPSRRPPFAASAARAMAPAGDRSDRPFLLARSRMPRATHSGVSSIPYRL